MKTANILEYITEQSNLTDFRAKSYLIDSVGQNKPFRNVFHTLYGYFDAFVDTQSVIRMIVLSGVRGSGKTTLLFQLYSKIQNTDYYTLFLSLDHISSFLGFSISDILLAYERQLGYTFENLDKPLILFLDEGQYDTQCIDALRGLMNRSDKIFIFLSGSPVLKNQIVSDSRIVHQKIYPVSSPEYIKITKKKFQIPGLGESIRDAILFSENSASLFANLQSIAPEVNTYYKGSLQSDFYRYFCYGSLPNLLASENESNVYREIQGTIERILHKDLPSYSFHPDTVALIPNMLFDLSVMDHCNVKGMALKFGLSRSKMSEVLDALESAELLKRIYPYGLYASEVISRKPSKYLFSSPVFRVIYLRLLSDIVSNEHAKYKITEDLVAMYLSEIFENIGKGTLMYDGNHTGANFIIGLSNEDSIIIQIGTARQGVKRILETRKKIPSKYGIIITENQLDYDPVSGIILMPLRMFLLIST